MQCINPVYVMYLARWLNNFTALEEKFMIFVRSPYEMRLRCAIVFWKGLWWIALKNMKFLPNVILMLSLWKNIVYQNCWPWWMRLCILTSCTKQTIHSKNQEIKEKGKKSHVARRYTFTEKIRTLTFSVTDCNHFQIGAFYIAQFLRWCNEIGTTLIFENPFRFLVQ